MAVDAGRTRVTTNGARLISIDGVSKVFAGRAGAVEALRQIDLEIRENEIIDFRGNYEEYLTSQGIA